MPFRLLFAENGYVHVCGHRGNSMNAPENTLPALESARRQGASTCEIDIVLSRDGEIVAFDSRGRPSLRRQPATAGPGQRRPRVDLDPKRQWQRHCRGGPAAARWRRPSAFFGLR